MNPALWICIFLPLFLMLVESGQHRRVMNQKRARRRRKERNAVMNEIIQRCLGKQCIIYMGGIGGDLTGVVEAVEGNWLSLRTSKTVETVNLDYISRIREVPEKKK